MACGARYEDFRGWRGNALAYGHEQVRLENEHSAEGWFPSLGPALWALRVQKLLAFYAEHQWCGAEELFDVADPVPF